MTTGDISQQTASVTKDGAAEEELRRLYLSARYDDNANLSDEDVKQAGEVTKKIYG